MKVTATMRGFYAGVIREAGSEFEIRDEPKRRVGKDEDAATQQASVKGQVSIDFSSYWMSAGWIQRFDGPSVTKASTAEIADLNENVI